MATLSTTTVPASANSEFPHRLRLSLAIMVAVAFILWLAWIGADYYRLDLDQRVESPSHASLRPSGTIGLKLGMLGVALFLVLFLYPLRKRWKWLGSIGKTKRWLDFHSLVGITAPVVITFHAAFKFGGLAGWAYWIMIAVAASGFIGRYLYTQIPRSIHQDELEAGELERESGQLADELGRQLIFHPQQLAALLKVPTAAQVKGLPLLSVLWRLLMLDLRRPLLVSSLRRAVISGGELLTTLGGLLPSRNAELETIIRNATRQSRLKTKIAFLDRIRQMFHLWHVIHRPFSISFACLIVVHIGVVILLGYF